VLDVAGGKGEVARKLQELGVKCRVIDPRQQAHKESLRWRDQSHEQVFCPPCARLRRLYGCRPVAE